jgi:hypothetical protein
MAHHLVWSSALTIVLKMATKKWL